MTHIELRDVWVKYRGARDYALKGVNLKVGEGVLAVIGPTGAGKTTLCKVMTGIIPNMGAYDDFKGEVLIDGRPTKGVRVGEISKKCAMVFQDYESQLFRTTVELEVAFGPENLLLPIEEIRERVSKSIKAAGLEGLEKRYSFALSGGQKQRLAIASLLSLQPSVLILDEATSDLDPLGKREIYEVAKGLMEQKIIKSLVIVDHHLEKIAAFADKVVVMQDGRVIRDGPVPDILSEVELLTALGLHPPDIAMIFNHLGSIQRPYTLSLDDTIKRMPRVLRTYSPPSPTLNSSEPAITLEDIWFCYQKDEWVIKGLNLVVRKGDMMGLIGQNGSGKTTLAQLIAGILRPARGKVLVFGKDMTKFGVMIRGKEIGYIFQNPDYQIFSNTVREEISYGLKAAGMPEQLTEARVKEVSEMLGISNLLDEDPFFLNKADRQRVAVASILALNPRVIILDEPTTGLSPGETTALMNTVAKLNEMGTTLITITHDMWVVAKYCNRVVLMADGRVVLDGPTRTIFSDYEFLEKYDIEVPTVVKLSKLIVGHTYLTVEELLKNVEFQTR
ncbi:MAG: energy-coupling factor transporter ATPase [Candidatus Caldarchaeum sp.]